MGPPRTAALVFSIASIPSVASAGNGLHPRTPVVWPEDTACMTVVDRSDDPVLHIDYEIPYEDPMDPGDVAEDEVEDSRTHQFLAFCRQKQMFQELPNFVSVADADAAVLNELVDPTSVMTESVLETSEVWEGCWERIIADEDRRPIFYEFSEQGVDWDTSGLPIGGWTVQGLTHEPAFNRWWQRPGVVKIIDGDSDAAGPAGAISNGEELIYVGCSAVIHGCVDAPSGTTATLSYASTRDRENGTWVPLWIVALKDVPIDGDTFEIEFAAPVEQAGYTIVIKVDFTDPDGRTFTAHMLEEFIVLASTDPTCGEGETSGEASGSGGETGSTGPDPDPTSSSESGPEQDGDGGGGGNKRGCACDTDNGGGRAQFLLFLAIGVLWPRRRS